MPELPRGVFVRTHSTSNSPDREHDKPYKRHMLLAAAHRRTRRPPLREFRQRFPWELQSTRRVRTRSSLVAVCAGTIVAILTGISLAARPSRFSTVSARIAWCDAKKLISPSMLLLRSFARPNSERKKYKRGLPGVCRSASQKTASQCDRLCQLAGVAGWI